MRGRAAALAILLVPSLSLATAAGTRGWTVGVPAEPTLAASLLRVAASLLGILLLAAGARLPRFTASVLFLAVGLPLGYALAAEDSYLLALALSLAFAALLLLPFLFLPRLGGALLAFWVPPALYAAWVLHGGALWPRPVPFLALLAAGALAGALFPRCAVAAAAAGLGTLSVAFALPGVRDVRAGSILFAAALLWNLLLILWLTPFPPAWIEAPPDRRRRLFREWRGALAGTAGALAAGVLLLLLLLPAPSPSSAEGSRRLERLGKSGAFSKGTLLLAPEDGAYLWGRPLAPALLLPRPGALGRLALPLGSSSPLREVHRMRAVKEPPEISRMERAAEITAKAFAAALPRIRPGGREEEVEEAVLETFRWEGASGLAFPPLVAGGTHAVLPHYDANRGPLEKGFLVLDIGCTVEGYAADRTRTYPVGPVTPAMRTLFETVLKAKHAAEAAARPGVPLREADRAAREVISRAGFGPYFIHGVGHTVGLNVHDVPAPLLRENMVVTLEPGIYIPEGSPLGPAFGGLGVRVEDTYVVAAEGVRVLAPYPEDPAGILEERPASP
ncbi:MAG: M24 family metallopeptidase [Acidobacteriota bacterium]